jgi:PAS domain S-box-containing protein
MKSNSFNEIPSIFLIKWQEIADLIASVINIPAALIMRVEDEFMEVFISSNTENNPYQAGDKEKWNGLYCKTVIKSQKKLLIPNALKAKDWDINPGIKPGMIAYLGFPINFQDNQPFGTICVLDNKENSFSPAHEKLMLHFKNVIELDLSQMERKKHDLSQAISEQRSQLVEKNIELNTAKEKAERNESDLKRIQEITHTGSWYLDVKTNKVEWSEELYKMYGFDPALPPPPYTEHMKLFTSESWEILSTSLAKTRKTGVPYELELKTIRKDKSNGWMWVRGEAVFDESNSITGLWGVAQDVTGQKKAEQELLKIKEQAQESEEKYRAFYDNAPLSYQSLDENGCFIDINPMWSKTLGYERSEVIGKWYGDFLHPDYVEHFRINFPVLKKRGCVSSVHFKLRRKDNTYIYVSLEGYVGYTPEGKFKQTYCVFKDITEQKALEQHLLKAKEKAEESERNLQLINEELEMFKTIAEDAVYGKVISDLKGNIIYVNKFFAYIHGYTPQELTGQNLSLIYSQKQMEVVGRLNESMIKNGNFAPAEVWHINRKGTEFPMLMSGTLIKDETGNPLFVAANAVDITERKQAEEALRKSEAVKNTMVSNIGDVIVVIDRNGINQYKSPNVTKQFGWKPEELVGKSTWDNVYPDDLEAAQVFFGTIVTKPNATGTIELRYKRKDGDYVWIEINATNLLHDRDIQGILGNYHDITERKWAEEALHKSNQRLESLVDISHKITSTMDQNVIMQMIVDNAIRLVGLDTGAVYLKTDAETIRLSATTPALPNNFPDDLRNASLRNHPHLNKALQTGKHVLIEDALSAILTFEEKQIVDLRKLRTILYQPIMIRNRAMGALILSSIETTRIFKYDDLKMLLAYANQAAHIIDNVKNYTSLKKHTHELEQQIKQREKVEKELVKAKEKAEESDRLKSAFLANMSHEIRTPMNGILGFANLLKKPGLKDEKQHTYIGIIEKSGKRMLNIINDIVDISKIEAGLMKLDLNESNINEHIEDIYTFFNPEAEDKGIKLSYENTLPAKEAIINTDSEKVYAILANLVKNSIKYTEEGSIELGYNLKRDTYPGELEFYVKDTGIGIPKERQEAIFDRFIQADITNEKAHQGAGLGLAITKAYVEMLGGKIWVESEEDKGSTFYFTLPYKTEPAAETKDHQLQPSGKYDDVRKLKILIAEDDEVSEMLLYESVIMFAKETLKARTGGEAVEACRDNPDIDLIMMDIRMPEMSGYKATQQIREFNKNVIIIAQTAYGQTGDRERSIESGCNDYLAKPVNENELHAMILKYFGK